jgi:Spore Coat Protein U domain
VMGLGISASAYAGSTTAALTVSGNLASSCAINFSAGTSTLTALVSGSASTGAATFNITCTPGISTLALGAVSTNGWRILGGSQNNDYISYTVTATTPPSGFATTWSGTAGSTTSVAVVTTTTQPVFTGTAVAIPLTIATQAVPATSNQGSYADTVTMTASF